MAAQEDKSVIIGGKEIIEIFIESGVIPEHCQSMTIHADYHDVVKVEYQVIGTNRLANVLRKLLLKQVK